jgi:hypothetical protein
MFFAVPAFADEAIETRVAELERRVHDLPPPIVRNGPDGGVFFLFGAFCALWAQNTNRNPWLWFFLGLIFNVFTVIALLIKNSEGRKRMWQKGQAGYPDL